MLTNEVIIMLRKTTKTALESTDDKSNPFHLLPNETISKISSLLVPSTDSLSASDLKDIFQFSRADKRTKNIVDETPITMEITRTAVIPLRSEIRDNSEDMPGIEYDEPLEYCDLGTFSHVSSELNLRHNFFKNFDTTCTLFKMLPKVPLLSDYIENQLETSADNFEANHPDPLAKRFR